MGENYLKLQPKRGLDLLKDSHLTKFTSFSREERDELNLTGLVPYSCEDTQLQVKREINAIRNIKEPLDKHIHLVHLQQRCESLFYQVVIQYIEELMPISYTPTVGDACLKFSEILAYPRGLTITLDDIRNIEKIFENWKLSFPKVKAIVVTDGEKILGLGDLGANGMGIPIGKLQLYVATGGIDPSKTLPILIDVGSNNEKIRGSEFYIGVKQSRAKGKQYDELLDEFISSVQKSFGVDCLIQFEDFGNSNAFRLLDRYRKKALCFNDDIQGTAAVYLAGVLASLRVTKKNSKGAQTLADHSFVFFGSGEASIGAALLVSQVISKESKCSIEEARKKIWLIDSKGLVCVERKKELVEQKLPFAHEIPSTLKLKKDSTLLEVVREVKATCLIGASKQAQSFTEEICKQMSENCERPLIFALSNPTSKAECTAEQAINWTNGKCLYCSGSPFPPVKYKNKEIRTGEANNAFIFPGMALGVLSFKIEWIPDELFESAARAVASIVSDEDLENGLLLPPIQEIRDVSARIAAEIGEKAYEIGLAKAQPKPENLLEHAKQQMFTPFSTIPTTSSTTKYVL